MCLGLIALCSLSLSPVVLSGEVLFETDKRSLREGERNQKLTISQTQTATLNLSHDFNVPLLVWESENEMENKCKKTDRLRRRKNVQQTIKNYYFFTQFRNSVPDSIYGLSKRKRNGSRTDKHLKKFSLSPILCHS